MCYVLHKKYTYNTCMLKHKSEVYVYYVYILCVMYYMKHLDMT